MTPQCLSPHDFDLHFIRLSSVFVFETWLVSSLYHSGTKIDLRENKDAIGQLACQGLQPVKREHGIKLANKIHCVKYMECSALTQRGLKQVMPDLIVRATIAHLGCLLFGKIASSTMPSFWKMLCNRTFFVNNLFLRTSEILPVNFSWILAGNVLVIFQVDPKSKMVTI